MARMERPPDISSRVKLLRFSLRSLFLLVTSVGIYFGGWEITKLALDDWLRAPELRCDSPIPYLVVTDELDAANCRYLRRGYLCCVGVKVKLPLPRECSDRQSLILGGVIPKVIIREEEEAELDIAVP